MQLHFPLMDISVWNFIEFGTGLSLSFVEVDFARGLGIDNHARFLVVLLFSSLFSKGVWPIV